MSQNIYLLYEPQLEEYNSLTTDQIFVNKCYPSEKLELTEEILIKMANNCMVEYFYVIAPRSKIILNPKFFKFKPSDWEKEYVHIWKNDATIRLFNKNEVVKNPTKFTDDALIQGEIDLKIMTDASYEYPTYDIMYLSYDEVDADRNYDSLRTRFPRAVRVPKTEGIRQAHLVAASLAKEEFFYVVDADAEIMPTFNFDYQPKFWDYTSAHVWHARNLVNGLEYGYGGIKMFPRKEVIFNVLRMEPKIDFTTSFPSLKVIPEVSNITHYHTTPF